jgi:Flp pilus assembly pilin Flp
MKMFDDTTNEIPVLFREDGQTMAEYGVVLAVITAAVVAVFTVLSGGVEAAINNVTSLLP